VLADRTRRPLCHVVLRRGNVPFALELLARFDVFPVAED
jgi:hypothetical protein